MPLLSTHARLLLLAALVAVVFVGCDSNDEDDDDDDMEQIDPTDANALSNAIRFSANADRIQGPAPEPTADADSPTLDGATAASVSPGGQVTLSLDVNGTNPVAGYYVQIVGADSYFDVDYAGGTLTDGTATLGFTVPDDVAAGGFNVAYCVYDDNGLISNVENAFVNVSIGFGEGEGDVRVTGTIEDAYDGTSFAFVQTDATITTAIIYVFDNNINEFEGDDGRFAFIVLSGSVGERSYSIGSFTGSTIVQAGYYDYRGQSEEYRFMDPSVGNVTGSLDLTTFEDDRVAGDFDYSGVISTESGENLGQSRVRGSFDAVIETGTSPFDPTRLPEGVPAPEELMREIGVTR